MANKQRGYLKLKIGKKQRTLHFSTNFWALFTDDLGIGLDGLGDAFTGGVSLSQIIKIVHCGLKAYDLEEGNDIDYNEFKVGSWLDDINPDAINEIVETMMSSRILGNDLNMGIERNVKKSTKGK